MRAVVIVVAILMGVRMFATGNGDVGVLLIVIVLSAVGVLALRKPKAPPHVAPRAEPQPQRETFSPPPSARSIPPSPPRVRARWVPPGETCEVGGFTITGGMLYVGSSLPAAGQGVEPSLIDPGLPVEPRPVHYAERQMDYWPSYSGVSPAARRAYLQWLANGRRDPSADIEYVFLFFYGIERRVLHDALDDVDARAQIPFLASEVRQLLKVYADNRSFLHYAGTFLDVVNAQRATSVEAPHRAPPAASGSSRELSFGLRLGLGQFAAAERQVPEEWAWTWAQSEPAVSIPKALRQNEAEFRRYFPIEYRRRFGDGMRLPQNRTRLRLQYRPASPGFFGRQVTVDLGDIPDVSAVIAPVKKLQAVVDECAAAIAPYSRYRTRNPGKEQSLEAILLLPQALWPSAAKAATEELVRRVGTGLFQTTLGETAAKLGGTSFSRDRVRALAHALEERGIGIEPDVLAGARSPRPDDAIVLFHVDPEDGSLRSSPAYRAAAQTMDLATALAMADGVASAPELRFLMKTVEGWGHLTAAQRKRLIARMRLGLASPPTLTSLKKRFEAVPIDARRGITRILSSLAQADGVVSPEEVKLLEKICRALGVDVRGTYADLHAAATATPPIPAQTARAERGPPRDPAPQDFRLDPERIAALQRETEQVSELLANVFQEEAGPEDVEEASEAAAPEEPGLLGLDSSHTAFLRLMVSRPSWARSDLAGAAADMDVMLDGALERVNGASLDAFGETVTDGDDPIEVSRTVIEKLA